MERRAYAKLNLTLDILGKREDGYHDLRMVMQTVDLYDTVSVVPSQVGGRISTNLSYLPNDKRNLVWQAAEAFRRETGSSLRVDIAVDKHIPVCAGMAGGSSDAAAVLLAMNELACTGLSVEQLCRIGETVGSDVPYCVMGGTALAEGRGERLRALRPMPCCQVVICKPPFAVSTPQLFSQVDARRLGCHPDTGGVLDALEKGELTRVARRLYNVFEDLLEPRRRAEVRRIRSAMIDCGALGASMTGSGPSVFGLFDDPEAAKNAAAALGEEWADVFLCRTV